MSKGSRIDRELGFEDLKKASSSQINLVYPSLNYDGICGPTSIHARFFLKTGSSDDVSNKQLPISRF